MLKNGIVSWKDFKALFRQGCQTGHCYKAMQAVQGIGSQIRGKPPPLKISFQKVLKYDYSS